MKNNVKINQLISVIFVITNLLVTLFSFFSFDIGGEFATGVIDIVRKVTIVFMFFIVTGVYVFLQIFENNSEIVTRRKILKFIIFFIILTTGNIYVQFHITHKREPITKEYIRKSVKNKDDIIVADEFLRNSKVYLYSSEVIASDESILQSIACNDRVDEGRSLRLTRAFVWCMPVL